MSAAIKNRISGKRDNSTKLKLVRIHVRAYLSSSFLVLTIFKMNMKKHTDPITRITLNTLLI
jgi:hypothetical protein